MAYVESRTVGKAAAHLALRILDNADDQFTTTNEILYHLKTVYYDPNKLQNAKYEFKRLIMKRNDRFYTFLTKFVYLAGEAKIPKSEYKFELNSKLSFELYKAVITDFISNSDYIKFSEYCS